MRLMRRQSLFIDSVEYLFRGAESVHGRGHACIDAGLQKDLCHLLACDAIIPALRARAA